MTDPLREAADTMRAVVQGRYGDAGVLRQETIALPEAADGEVLVRVHAAGVNALDWHVMRGSPAWALMMIGLRRPKARCRPIFAGGSTAIPRGRG